MNLPTLPVKTHEEALKLKQAVYDFVPQQYHEKIEFSFQIFDTEQTKKLKGWRMGFSTFTMDGTNTFSKVLESKPNPKEGKGNITSHTHLTRNEEKEDIEIIKELQVRNRRSSKMLYLKFGYAYIHWKLLLPGDTPRHKWDTEKIEIAKSQPIMQPIYVGEYTLLYNVYQRKRRFRFI